jgi:hypothetical protein
MDLPPAEQQLAAESPFTFELCRNIDQAGSNKPLNVFLGLPDRKNIDDAYGEVWKGKLTHGLPNPDSVCFPGHALVNLVSGELFRYGAPGLFSEQAKPQTTAALFQAIERGTGAPGYFEAFLPVMGQYILHLWLLWSWWSGDPRKGWNIPIEAFGFSREGTRIVVHPCPATHALSLEWYWMLCFVDLASKLKENRLDVIPPRWPCQKAGHWKQAKEIRIAQRHMLPFRFDLISSKAKGNDNLPVIMAVAQRQDLPLECIPEALAHLERIILRRLDGFTAHMQKLRLSHHLTDEDLTEDLYDRMLRQATIYKHAFPKDSALNTTAFRMSQIGIWADPAQAKQMDEFGRIISGVMRRASGLRPGRPVKPEPSPRVIAFLIQHEPEAEKIYKLLRPLINKGTRKDLRAAAQEHIRLNHESSEFSEGELRGITGVVVTASWGVDLKHQKDRLINSILAEMVALKLRVEIAPTRIPDLLRSRTDASDA